MNKKNQIMEKINVAALLATILYIGGIIGFMNMEKTPDFAEYIKELGSSSRFEPGFTALSNLVLWVYSYDKISALHALGLIGFSLIGIGCWVLSKMNNISLLYGLINTAPYAFIHVRASIAIGIMLIALRKIIEWETAAKREKAMSVLLLATSFTIHYSAMYGFPIIISGVVFGNAFKKNKYLYLPKPKTKTTSILLASLGLIAICIAGLGISNHISSIMSLAVTFNPFERTNEAIINYTLYNGSALGADASFQFMIYGIARCAILAITYQVIKDCKQEKSFASTYRRKLLTTFAYLPYISAFLITALAKEEGFTRIIGPINPIIDVATGITITILIAECKGRRTFTGLAVLGASIVFMLFRIAKISKFFG